MASQSPGWIAAAMLVAGLILVDSKRAKAARYIGMALLAGCFVLAVVLLAGPGIHLLL